MAYIFNLSNELLQSVLEHVEPEDLGHLSQTCRAFHAFIKSNRLLWKGMYLKHFDNPQQQEDEAEPSWETELPKFVALDKLLSSEDREVKRANFSSIASAILDLVVTQARGFKQKLNSSFLSSHFEKEQNVDVILCASTLFAQAGSFSQICRDKPEERQMSAKLHVLHGVPKDVTMRRLNPVDCYARSRVYDLRYYTENTLWGPFMPDGSYRVDWENLESIMLVLAYNIQYFNENTHGRCPQLWYTPFDGAAPNTFRDIVPSKHSKKEQIMRSPTFAGDTPTGSTSPPQVQRIDSLTTETALPLEEQDPYGVTGTYIRVVCFLDYNDLYAFNFDSDPIPDDQPREPISTQEAIRFITIKLRVKKIEPSGPDDGQALPVVHFTGTSRSINSLWDPNANSRIRGTVRLTSEGEVRWTTFSIFNGEERWRSESIQIGGVRSGRGMLGTWFDKDYDPHGPAGPTAFWKISDVAIGGEDESIAF